MSNTRPRVYLDTCAIQRPLDYQSQQRVRLEADAVLLVLDAVERGDVVLLTSPALRAETEQVHDPVRLYRARGVLSLASVEAVLTPAAEGRAKRLQQNGLGVFDAQHLSLAIEGGADFLCTVDDLFLRRARAIYREHTESRSIADPLGLFPDAVNRKPVLVVLPHELIYALSLPKHDDRA